MSRTGLEASATLRGKNAMGEKIVTIRSSSLRSNASTRQLEFPVSLHSDWKAWPSPLPLAGDGCSHESPRRSSRLLHIHHIRRSFSKDRHNKRSVRAHLGSLNRPKGMEARSYVHRGARLGRRSYPIARTRRSRRANNSRDATPRNRLAPSLRFAPNRFRNALNTPSTNPRVPNTAPSAK